MTSSPSRAYFYPQVCFLLLDLSSVPSWILRDPNPLLRFRHSCRSGWRLWELFYKIQTCHSLWSLGWRKTLPQVPSSWAAAVQHSQARTRAAKSLSWAKREETSMARILKYLWVKVSLKGRGKFSRKFCRRSTPLPPEGEVGKPKQSAGLPGERFNLNYQRPTGIGFITLTNIR